MPLQMNGEETQTYFDNHHTALDHERRKLLKTSCVRDLHMHEDDDDDDDDDDDAKYSLHSVTSVV